MDTINDYYVELAEKADQLALELPSPIDLSKVNEFKSEFEKRFNQEAPEAYINFLKFSDGLEFNGYVIYGSVDSSTPETLKGIFESNSFWNNLAVENELFEIQELIFYAESGLELWVYDKVTKQFQVLDRVSMDVYESFSNCEDFLTSIMKLMLGRV